ncbi:putative bifunctional diguanylate cyclase/phosphodiesterase [Alteromonas aestuariivivens]|nr:bifunctional diguanylate cyclase/phosphodiesterase [Alteromonas aestuariivivens]
MPSKLEIIKNDTQLRKRLLVGCIALSLVVIAVFFMVGLNLVIDVEKRLSEEAYTDQLTVLRTKIQQHLADDPNHIQDIKNELPAYLKPLSKDIVYISINGEMPIYSSEMKHDYEWMSKPFPGSLAPGFFYCEHATFYYNHIAVDDSGNKIYAIWHPSSLILASKIAINRLSITAILTFWLAVWAALVMSALITKRFEKANLELENLALVDSLTKLKNHNALYTERVLSGQSGALFFLDIDHFKDVNSALGHETGDRLLVAFAQRLVRLIGEKGTVYRYRSDEFIIWAPSTGHENIQTMAFQILYECRAPLNVDDNGFELSCSIGAAEYPAQGKLLEILVKNAEHAMYRAKRLRLGVQVYHHQLASNQTVEVTLRSQLRSALMHKQFVLYYQPKVAMATETLTGFEAIVRWHHPDEGILPPGQFIDLIEQSGIVHVFTRYTIEQAVEQILRWQKMGYLVPVSVNLSAYNLMDNAFVPFIQGLLQRTGVSPNMLEFELTESATMVDIKVSKKMIEAFNNLGIRTSIDDFGTGMSSFAYLRELDIHTVKLDRAFIRQVHTNSKDQKIVEGIVSLCRNLNVEIVAEGVEVKAQAEVLQRLDCHLGQGFLFGKPAPAEKVERLLNREFAAQQDFDAVANK